MPLSCGTYLRRFAFAVWAAGQLGERLPADFFTAGAVPELLRLLRRHRFFTPYYLLFRLRLKGSSPAATSRRRAAG